MFPNFFWVVKFHKKPFHFLILFYHDPLFGLIGLLIGHVVIFNKSAISGLSWDVKILLGKHAKLMNFIKHLKSLLYIKEY